MNDAKSVFLIRKGKLFSIDTIDESAISVSEDGEILWGVLLAPAGIQAARHPTKLMKRNISYAPIRALAFNVRHISHPGTLHLTMAYFTLPFDFHLTGRGMSLRRGSIGKALSGRESTVTIGFPSPLTLEVTQPDMNVCYEVEVSYQSDVSDNAYVVLDACEPVVLQA